MICETLLNYATQATAIAILVAQVFALLAEFWDWFQKLPFEIKRWLMLLACLIIPVGSLLIGGWYYDCEGMVVAAESMSVAIAAGIAAFASGQLVGHPIARWLKTWRDNRGLKLP